MKFLPFEKGAEKVLDPQFSHFNLEPPPPPNPVINDQSLTPVSFEDLFLLSPQR